MQAESSKLDLRQRGISLLRRFSEWRRGILVILVILGLALATRTNDLSSFPYFPSKWPWYGVNGLYTDEYDISLLPFSSSAYFPFLQVALMGLAINIFGYTTFAIRIVSALFSSATSVLVYLSSYELFHRKLPSFLSSLYFIFMTPALIYGRMAFVENGAATFFVATFLFGMKYVHTSKNRWLVCSIVSAGLSFLCKQLGFAAIIFLVLFILAYKPESKNKLLKLVLLAGILVSIYFVQIIITNPSSLSRLVTTYIYAKLGSVSWFNMFLCNILPSGVSLTWMGPLTIFTNLFGFVTLDFWCVLPFFVILYLVLKERKTARLVLLPILSYILVLVLIGHANAYYVIMMLPFMAIPVGYGLLKLRDMPTLLASAFALFLCFPAIAYVNYYVSYFLIPNPGDQVWVYVNIALGGTFAVLGGVRYLCERTKMKPVMVINRFLLAYYIGWLIIGSYMVPLYSDAAWVVLQFNLVVPIVIIGFITFWNEGIRREEASVINRFLLVFYIACLVIGSYILPVYYPGYFAQSTVPT